MFSRLLLVLCLLMLSATVRAQTDYAPQSGYLLLRNGNLLPGEVTPAGDYFLITTGSASELRLPKDQVEAVCRDLNDAYTFRLTAMHGTGVRSQIDMAEWCLRYRLFDKAEEHLAELARIEPTNASIKTLQQRLKIARESRDEQTGRAQASAPVLPSELDRAEESLPAKAVEKFTVVVQPLLINRCAAGSCHGAQSTSAFQIIRPPTGQLIQRRATQRNLLSALKYIDHEHPEQSPLLLMPITAHGGAKVPVFDHKSKDQVIALANWVEQVLAPKTSTQPASIQPAVARMNAPNGNSTQTSGASAGSPGKSITANVSPDDPTETAGSNDAPLDGPFRARDPFDPEIFHRRQQVGKKTAQTPAGPGKPAAK